VKALTITSASELQQIIMCIDNKTWTMSLICQFCIQ